MKGGGGIRGGAGGGLMLTRLRLPVVLLSCSLFFLAGFFGSLLFTQDPQGEEELDLPLPRERLLEAVWPRMAYGESGEPAPSLIPYQILSWQPRVLYFPQFATSKHCENIVQTAKERLMPSTLALRKGETKETTKGIRTSSGTFLSANEDPTGTLAEVEKKIAMATMISRDHGEPFNVLRYEIGQRYASHYDAFDPAQYGPQKSQRVASFLLYLTDVEEGGETMFPYENGENMDIGYDYEKCIGLKVKPRKGDGLLFYSLMVNGFSPKWCSWVESVIKGGSVGIKVNDDLGAFFQTHKGLRQGYLIEWILAKCMGRPTEIRSEGDHVGGMSKVGICGEANPQFSWVEA